MKKRTRFNHKRKLHTGPLSNHDLMDLASTVSYGGNPEHKRNPGDFGLTPPSHPRPDKALCDAVGVFTRREATALLRKGVTSGLVSEQWIGGFPQNIWSVAEDGTPLEAQLENHVAGTYHGYPMPESDPFRLEVLERWKQTP